MIAILLPIGCAVGEEGASTSFFNSAGYDGPTGDPGDGSPGTGTSISATASASDTGEGTSSSDDVPGDEGSEAEADTTGTSTPAECGNGVQEGDEGCDGADHGGLSCADFGFDEGVLTCTPTCTLITEACWKCGDGMVSFMEVCDGNNLDGQTCQTQGFAAGTLACSSDCHSFDTSGCPPLPSCGDGLLNGGEQCDGNNLGGHTCQTQGFDLGQLACTPQCTFDTSGCDYDVQNCSGQGEFCIFDENNPQSTCCPPGVKGNIFGICDIFLCI